ncbi:PAS domain S-box protein [Caulobacter sp. KR2-114]|uniref:PAS domain S-box protein n=1 Tax=Caulobacter sp. KR2-114 TaxID=3400912 RepID=UPI003C0E4FE1
MSDTRPADPALTAPGEHMDALREAAGAWVWDEPAGRLYADARFANFCGLDPEEARRGLPTSDFFAGVIPEDRLRVRIALAGILRGSETFSKTYRVRGAGGVVRWVSASGITERDLSGALQRFTGVLVDITEQKRIEEQLRIAQTAGGVGTFEHTYGFGTAEVSAQFCRLLGLQPTDALPVRTINTLVEAGDPLIIRSLGEEGALPYSEMRIRRADDGAERWLARRGERRPDSVSGGERFIGVIYDITPAKLAEAELRELARTLEDRVAERTRERDRVWNRARDLIMVLSPGRQYLAINPAWGAILGYEQDELLGRAHGILLHPDDEAGRGDILERLGRGEAVEDLDLRVRAKDGAYHWINWTFIPEDGFIYGIGRDVTERKQLEDQLRQSQKMEAVGQLTGGLAHDFNNMLTGIMGGLDMARRRIAQGRSEEAESFLETATQAAERAAALTHRLLAFSRRQTLDSQPVEANVLVSSMEDMLRRTLGEQVSLGLALQADIWPTRTDPNQLESAILNLAINARDAMPAGGQLTIETANVRVDWQTKVGNEEIEPGEYVMIAVSDTGLGMAPDVLAKVFDPFFTTKPIGQGTGLGLSMVYGFVRQTGGRVGVYSEPGVGTTVKLYLPRLRGEREAVESDARHGATPRGAGESVLLVEDDPQVRVLVRTVLEELGYRATEAVDSRQALAILDTAGPLNLLITDVGLPGMNGRQLAEIARARRPDLPVLFMTGYAAGAAERSAFLMPGMQMISKPFALETLAKVLRETLGGSH